MVAACRRPRARLLDKLNRSDVRLIVSGHLHQHLDRTFGGQRHLWVPAVAFAAPQAYGGDGRCGVGVLDFSQDSVEITIERPHGLVSHALAAIKGHGRYQFLRDMPPSPPPHAGRRGLAAAPRQDKRLGVAWSAKDSESDGPQSARPAIVPR